MKSFPKLFVAIFLLVLTNQLLLAQNKVIDSLENLLQNHKEKDTIRVNTLNYLAFHNYRNNPPQAIIYIEEALKLGNELQVLKFIAKSHYIKAAIYIEQSNFKVAKENNEKAIKIYESIGDLENLSKCKNAYGILNAYQGNYKLALKYYEESLAIKVKLGIKKGVEGCLYNIGNIYLDTGDYKNALINYNQALVINKKDKDSLGILNNLNSIAGVYYEQANYPLSLDYYNQSLQIAQKSKDSIGMFQSLLNIGNLYRQQYLNDKALNYYNKAAAINNAKYNVKNITALKNNIAGIYYDEGAYDTAVTFFNESIALSKKIDDKVNLGTALNGLGFIYLETKNFSKAVRYFKEGLKVNILINRPYDLSDSYQGLSETYYRMHKYDLALKNTKILVTLSNKHELLRHKNNAYDLLSKIYKKTGNYKKAFENHEVYKMLDDSLFNKEKVEKIARLEADYKYKKKIDSASIRELKLTKTVLTTSKDLKETQRNYLWAIIGVLIVSILLGGIIFYQKYKNVLTKNQNILTEQKLLRSQMTPHFIFNSLSVLQGMILNKEEKNAISYLSKFSKLLRTILENSRHKTVVLSEELSAIESYMSLQNLDIKPPFVFTLTQSKNVSHSKIQIPPMLIQPFIENAIEHAFPNQKDNKVINVHLKLESKSLMCTIEDNGIGINLELQKTNKHKSSLATTITSERLTMLSKEFKTTGSVVIENRELFNEQGTLVTLTIPYLK